MSTTYYYTVNDEIIGEHTLGQSRLDYLPDGLGSVIATVDQTLTVKSTARYKPYGADLATTGTQPAYGWGGSSGSYRRTGRPHCDLYMEARHDSTLEGQWTSVDPYWPRELAYIYVEGRPTLFLDRSGRNFTDCDPGEPIITAWSNYKARMASVCRDKKKAIQDAWQNCGEHDYEKEADCFCKHSTGAPGYGVDFDCYAPSFFCKNKMKGHCMGAVRGSFHGNCQIKICPDSCPAGIDWEAAILHEMMHCCGASHDPLNWNVQANPDCLEKHLRPIAGWPGTFPGWPSPIDVQSGDITMNTSPTRSC